MILDRKIAVLLTVHNRKDKTLRCLQNLYVAIKIIQQEKKYDFKIFLTDDGSTDGTADAVKLFYPEVIVLHGNGDLYWNRGMINSWKKASQYNIDFYIWLNDDTNLFPNALQLLFRYTETNRGCIFVGATKSESTDRITYSGEKKYRRLLPNGILQRCDTFNGNFVLVPRSAFNTLGYLDSRYSHSLGDYDYGRMATKKNINIYLLPEYTGYCEANNTKPICFDKSRSLHKRIQHLYSPLGCDPRKFFIYDLKHKGIFKAVTHFISINFKAIFPIF